MLRLGCCCYICKRWFLLILRRAFCPLEGGGAQTYWHQDYTSETRLVAIEEVVLFKKGRDLVEHNSFKCF